ncbi:MAG: winged helix-turn-helix domain-containing protein [Planctomycetota bacterium]
MALAQVGRLLDTFEPLYFAQSSRAADEVADLGGNIMSSGSPHVTHIGETAGVVWHILHANGPLSMARLVKAVGEPRDVVMQAIGWLAREDKLTIHDEGRSRIIGLR